MPEEKKITIVVGGYERESDKGTGLLISIYSPDKAARKDILKFRCDLENAFKNQRYTPNDDYASRSSYGGAIITFNNNPMALDKNQIERIISKMTNNNFKLSIEFKQKYFQKH